jgi:hypothetical protein
VKILGSFAPHCLVLTISLASVQTRTSYFQLELFFPESTSDPPLLFGDTGKLVANTE